MGPQHRERVFIVCFDRQVFGDRTDFAFPTPPTTAPRLGEILEKNVDPNYTLTPRLWQYLQDYAQKHKGDADPRLKARASRGD